jgi:hypothetical protein
MTNKNCHVLNILKIKSHRTTLIYLKLVSEKIISAQSFSCRMGIRFFFFLTTHLNRKGLYRVGREDDYEL